MTNLNNPSLKDLEETLFEEKRKLASFYFSNPQDKQKIINKIRMLRMSIEILRDCRALFN
jgi:hypothetical protein